MLAVTLGHLESIRVLLRHGTNVNVINRGGWTVVQEAVATGDPELLQVKRCSACLGSVGSSQSVLLYFRSFSSAATASATRAAWAASRTCCRS